MKLTLNWLKEHLQTSASITEIADALTALGHEVEGIKNPAEDLEEFRVVSVTKVTPHPDADRLNVCEVDTGTEKIQVVCAGKNVHEGMKAVLAAPGSTIPTNGMKMRVAKVRGVESHGMLCAADELGLEESSEGIIDLPKETVVGISCAEAMGLNDPMIEVKITPNRPDCLSVYGLARDLAAAGLGKRIERTEKHVQLNPSEGRRIGVSFDLGDDAEACTHFMGLEIMNVINGSSPEGIQARLRAIGSKPISKLVDITNLITIAYGRPLHVYDADKIQGDLVVRKASAGEKLEALDGVTYTLDPSMTVIADDAGVLGLGGIIGGMRSGCTLETKNVFLESAWFDPIGIAKTRRKLGISTDASFRFERGVDPLSVTLGIEEGISMILDLCGGDAIDVVSAGSERKACDDVVFRHGRVKDLGNMDVTPKRCREILEHLGFGVNEETKGTYELKVPTWRFDVSCEEDIVEEIMRVEGYDAIGEELLVPNLDLSASAIDDTWRKAHLVRRTLASLGLQEAITFSFMKGEDARLFGLENEEFLTLANPISQDLDVMRPSLVPNLLTAAVKNMARGQSHLALFEVGPRFTDDTPEGEHPSAAGIRTGQKVERFWLETQRKVDFYDAKADAYAALEVLGVSPDNLMISATAPGWYHPGRSAVLSLGHKTVLGVCGEVHPLILKHFGIKQAVVAFEIFLDRVPDRKAKDTMMRPPLVLSPYQAVNRDFAFIVDRGIDAAAVLSVARKCDKDLIQSVNVFDVYEGQGLGVNRKSLAITVTFQAMDRTLTDQEIDTVCQKIITAVKSTTGAELRQ